MKPSIGTNGRFCVCVKPNESFDAESAFEEELDKFNELISEYEAVHNVLEDASSMDDVYELYQSDFATGTYRIRKSGTYRIMEDIEFNFNAGDYDEPNSGSAWWPKSDQQDMYPGAGTTRGTLLFCSFILTVRHVQRSWAFSMILVILSIFQKN